MFKQFTKGLQSLLRMCDLFSVSQFIKYKGDNDYSTATGGFCSVLVLTIFAVLFTSLGIRTVSREIINWSSQTTKETEPSSITIEVSHSNPFLFTAGVMHLNINDPNIRYFDFALNQLAWTTGNRVTSNHSISLVPCTEQHFGKTAKLRQNFHNIQASKWLCPPIGQQFQLYGKFTSQNTSLLVLSVLKCDPLLDPSRPCASSDMMQQLQARIGAFVLTQFFINPLLNPGSQQYLDYYVEDTNFVAFTSKLGAYSNAYVQEYTIITDESILPFTQPKEEKGIIITEPFQYTNFQVTNSVFARLFFYKSSTSVTFNRSFYKLDDFFSYVGGIVGVITGFTIILKVYNQATFELSLAKNLLSKQDGSAFGRFNMCLFFLTFLRFLFKKCFRKCQEWQSLRKIDQIRIQMGKQLDISLILSRLLFLQRSVQVIFNRGQFQAMHLIQKPTIQVLKNLRRFYHIKKLMRKPIPLKMIGNLQQSQVEISRAENQVIQYKDGSSQESVDSDEGDDADIHRSSFMDSMKKFYESAAVGNRTSQRISRGINQKYFQGRKQRKQRKLQHQQLIFKESQEANRTIEVRIKPQGNGQKNQVYNSFEFIDT